jgi:hypothetical protein
MNVTELQQKLIDLGHDVGSTGADGAYGNNTRNAILAALTTSNPARLAAADYQAAATELGCSAAVIRGITVVESGGRGGFGPSGRPVILFEPHVFSRNSGHRFDTSHPAISSRAWNRALYAKTQDGRYGQLLDAVGLDVDAGFSGASYGLFQILGENWQMCKYPSAFDMVLAMAKSEAGQLEALIRFVRGKGLLNALRACSTSAAACVPFVKGYNGSGYADNNYHTKLAQAIGAG